MFYRHYLAEQVGNAIPALEPFTSTGIKIDSIANPGNGDKWWEANQGVAGQQDPEAFINVMIKLGQEFIEFRNRAQDIIAQGFEDFTDAYHDHKSSLAGGISEGFDDIEDSMQGFMVKLAYIANLTEKHPSPENEEELQALRVMGTITSIQTRESY